jgi:hypothetical protein
MNAVDIVLLIMASIIIILFLTGIIISVQRKCSGQGLNSECTNQNDCSSGYVCELQECPDISHVSRIKYLCKSGIDTKCSIDTDCISGLICSSGLCKTPLRTMLQSIPENALLNVNALNVMNNVNNANNANNIKNVNVINLDYNVMSSATGCSDRLDFNSGSDTDNQSSKYSSSSQFIQNNGHVMNNFSKKQYNRGPIRSSNKSSSNGMNTFVVPNNHNKEIPKPVQPIIDVCSFSNSTIALLSDGSIIKEVASQNETDIERSSISTNVTLIRLEAFNGYLYGISKGSLYKLDNSTYKNRKWIFTLVNNMPINIIHTSATLKSNHLWLQTTEKGYIIDERLNIISTLKIETGKRRIYGSDLDHYIEININECVGVSMPGSKNINNICGGGMTYNDEIISISVEMRGKFKEVRLVNWTPYYLLK